MFLKYYMYMPSSLKLLQNFHRKTPPVLLQTVDLCLEMSSDFSYRFCFVVEEIFKLGNTTNSISMSWSPH